MRTCPHCSSDVESASPCPLCGAPLPLPPRSPWPVVKTVAGLGLLVVLLALVVAGFVTVRSSSGERVRMGSLRMLAVAEADFRANDRDGNREPDYWTGDVAGLYCLSPAGVPIRLVELAVAGSDSDPLQPPQETPYARSIDSFTRSAARSGYWLWAMRADASVNPPEPYRREGNRHPSRFGFLAFPDSPSSGRYAFIINEAHTVFRKPVNASIRPSRASPPGCVTHPAFVHWPGEGALSREWTRPD